MNKYTAEQLLEMVREVNSWDNSLEEFEYWDNDEDFFSTFFNDNPMEVARSVQYGNYNYNDDFVSFDGYGNLESISRYDLDEELKHSAEEIVERATELNEEGHLDLDYLLKAEEEED